MSKKKINKIFDNQIKIDNKYIIDNKLFNLTINFSLDDWKFIRTEKYWKTIDSFQYDDKKKYTLKCVEYYINNFL